MRRWVRRALIASTALVALALCAQLAFTRQVDLPPRDDALLRVASYNVHYIWLDRQTGPWSVGDWAARRGALDAAFKTLDADLVAFQEMESFARGSDGSVNLARDWLLARNPGYAAGASGDWRAFPSTQPIFYRTDRLRLTDQGWFFFSDTPDVIYSMGFGGGYPAFASWAEFRTPQGDTFRVVNAHIDRRSTASRVGGAQLIRDRIAPWIARGERVILLGDLNAIPGMAALRILPQAGLTLLPQRAATYHADRGLHLFPAIDHVGLSPGLGLTRGPWVLQRRWQGDWPSDHHPIVADVTLR